MNLSAWQVSRLGLLGMVLATVVAMHPSVVAAASDGPAHADFYSMNGARAQDDGSIVDTEGRQLYLVPLDQVLAAQERPSGAPALADAMDAVLDALSANMALDRSRLSAVSGNLAAAFLDDDQYRALAGRTRRGALLPDRVQHFSGIWSDATVAGTLLPWGVQAVAGGHASTRTHTLYVIDSGVHDHPALSIPEADRLAVFGLPTVMVCPSAPGYAHGTHVAGIAGGNGAPGGVRGVRPNARIVSVNVGVPALCRPTTATIIAGLAKVREHVLESPAPRHSAVVNLSINFNDRNAGDAFAEEAFEIEQAMRSVATPVGAYPGAFIAQSAGNQGVDACRHAYRPAKVAHALPNDGIVVVATVDRNGQAGRPVWHPEAQSAADQFPRFHGRDTEFEPGNNDGGCVDTLAPGVDVVSTWSGQELARLSGTSMAAPHVAGMALHILENGLATTPAAVESALERRLLYGSNLFMAALEPEVFLTRPSIVFHATLHERNDADVIDYIADASWHKSTELHASNPAQFRTFADSYLTLRYVVDDAADELLACTARIFRNGWPLPHGALPAATLFGNGRAGTWHLYASHWAAEEGNVIRFQVDCPKGTGNSWPSGQSSVTVELQATPKPAWQVSAPSTAGAQVVLTRRASPTQPTYSGAPDIHWTAAAPWLEQGFAAPGAIQCQSLSYRIPQNGFGYGPGDLLFQSAVQGPFQSVVRYQPMPDQDTGLPGPGAPWIGRGFRWLLTCWNDNSGHHPQATSFRGAEMTGRRN